MNILDILERKGHDVVTITEDRSVLDAARKLVEYGIGGLVVTYDDKPTGIITERDILRRTASTPGELGTTPVGAAMTRDLVVADPDDGLREIMEVMTQRRVRHLPVVRDGQLLGIVSIGDLIKACLTLAEDENAHLRQYIHGGG
ncbi:MAG TPA: CBS domain-containing protein [Longimicrobiales bacterium]|nr:CBS domain-containing protein [Longimicrobiales bacterium]